MGQIQSYVSILLSTPEGTIATAGITTCCVAVCSLVLLPRKPKPQVYDDPEDKNTVVLYQIPRPRVKGYPNYSAPCAKLETYLRMSGVKFITKTALPSTGPKKKIPYIRVQGETVPDSQLCIWHLQKIKLPGYTDIDANLSSNQRILLESVRLLMEEIIYRQTAWERWANPANHYGTKSSIMTVIKNPIMKYILFHRVSKHNTVALHMHGFGRFSREEQEMFSKRAVDTISELLGDSQYILGPQPCSLDATVYAHMVDAIKSCEIWPDMPTGAYIKTKRNIMNYVDRMTKQYYPELLE